ncbi:hypothetical protein ACIHFE_33165 [Streptomyces sp. NPDC052396]|uniref:hypothetical protein n=1 Tax=Streptomyces sp. NPDC052396 TaxID=3365689 RepID=UPI0037D34C82
MRRVGLDRNAVSLCGNLFLLDTQSAVPGMDRCAQCLATHGLSFDFTEHEESKGEHRKFEDPELKVAGLDNDLTFLVNQPALDTRQLRSLITPWLYDAANYEEIYGGSGGVADKFPTGRDGRTSAAACHGGATSSPPWPGPADSPSTPSPSRPGSRHRPCWYAACGMPSANVPFGPRTPCSGSTTRNRT